MPKVEKELKNLLQSYEEMEGKSFLYNDERLLDVIHKQWDEIKNNKKNLQQTKVFQFIFINNCTIDIHGIDSSLLYNTHAAQE